ncbi:MAG: glycosyltransferase family 2 protein [Armatimonadota bacterium]|nr:glycosyltransferase family 2 protein [Armatimonadota bacterium]
MKAKMTEENPDLSITIVSFNTKDLTRQCLQSIFDGTHGICFEVWVVDNNSSDGSVDMIRHEFPNVNLIVNNENKGLAAATNQGLAKSTGRYVLALNSDTIVRPGALETMVRFMDEHPDVGGATPKLVLPDGGKHPQFCGSIPSLKTELVEALAPLFGNAAEALQKDRFGKPIDYNTSQEVQCILWGSSFIVRREVMEKIGLQDPRFFVYAEDIDWAMRIRKAGWKLYYIAEAEVVHYGGQSTKQSSSRMLAQKYRSKCRLIHKHYGFFSALVLRLAIALVAGIRLAKWAVIFTLRSSERHKAKSRIDQMWLLIRAALEC